MAETEYLDLMTFPEAGARALVADCMRGLQISYNFLNLPSSVTNAGMRTSTEYTYTSDGVKCSVMSGPMSGQVYLGSICCVAHGEEGDDTPVYEQSLYYSFGMRVETPAGILFMKSFMADRALKVP